MITTSVEGLEALRMFFGAFEKNGIRARNSALSSTGFEFKRRAKENAKNNVFNWPDLSAATHRIRLNPDVFKGNFGNPYPDVTFESGEVNKAKSKPWQSHVNFMIYEVDKKQGFVDVGFKAGRFGTKRGKYDKSKRVANIIGDPIVEIANRLTNGHQFLVTPQMQRYFRAIFIYVRVGQTISIPKRPIVVPTFERWGPDNILRFFAEKYEAAMIRYTTGIKVK